MCALSVGLALTALNTEAFVPQTATTRPLSVSHALRAATNDESSTKEVEKALRQELTERNSKVEDEGKYAVVDGTNMDTEKESAPATKDDDESSASSMTEEVTLLEKLIKKRPYPLFLAEKGVEIIEDTVDGLFGKDKSSDSDLFGISEDSVDKEKVVVLGTGWGAAAFLKGIDSSRYDVTVISPRNYFVFTPMLAGASVGTVDYRSITEPIREVRTTGLEKCILQCCDWSEPKDSFTTWWRIHFCDGKHEAFWKLHRFTKFVFFPFSGICEKKKKPLKIRY